MKLSLTYKLGLLSVALVAIMALAPAVRADEQPNKKAPAPNPPAPNSPIVPPAPVPNPSMQWQLGSVVSPWSLTTGRWTELPVTLAADSNITHIVLTQSTLIDADSPSGQVLHTNNICLSAKPRQEQDPDPPCVQDIPVPSGKVSTKQTIWLFVDRRFDSAGVFTGSLFFDTQPHTDTKSVAIKVQQTSCGWQWLGVAIILVGVVLAWLVTVFGRSRIARDQALMPALVLLDKLRDLQRTVEELRDEFEKQTTLSTAAIKILIQSLSTDKLDKKEYLPPSVPAFGPSVAKTAEYQTFLSQTSQKVEDLDILVSEGFVLLAARLNPTVQGQELIDLQTAVESIDELTTTLPADPAALRVQLAAVLQVWNDAHTKSAQARGVKDHPIDPLSAAQRSFIAVRLEIQTITVLFWLIWGLLSVIIGASVLIVPVPGFGSITDLIRCLLWGFGLPVAGSSIQSLTTGTLNTQLGVSITRN